MAESLPTPSDAAEAAREALGWTRVDGVRRFTTGLAFFVFEVRSGAEIAVIRLGVPAQREVLRHGLALWERLRPLGIPLPRLLADGTGRPLPYVAMERLAGRDLGEAIAGLDSDPLRRIARDIAEAQRRTATLGPAPGYGYAPRPELAPHANWAEVVQANLERSHRRLIAHGLFDPRHAERLRRQFDRLAPALAAQAATPFLHDTTTKNVIVSPEGTFSGIVDVDDLCFGDPRYAIGLTRAALLSLEQPTDYADAWLAQSGLADDAVLAFYTPLFLLDFMSEHGAGFNGNQAPSQPGERARLEAIFVSALRRLE